tara:strand:- start:801 stop:1688 length:888 start_codon:yes stop_codon:yes gene_type:complete
MYRITIIVFYLWIIFSCANDLEQNSLGADYVGTSESLDIITWNIENFPKQNALTIDSLASLINILDVDIIAMQEIGSELYFMQLIDKLKGWSGQKTEGSYGLAYIYKSDLKINKLSPILELDNYNLVRTPYMLELNWFGEIIYIINNHYKCCGNGIIENYYNDEEYRRLQACILTEEYIRNELENKNVILLGDFNDELSDLDSANVFNIFLNQVDSYKFVDLDISLGSSNNWSFPSWPSHLDHILITNELFDEFDNIGSMVKTIPIENYFLGGWNHYENLISDHRPLVIRLIFNN